MNQLISLETEMLTDMATEQDIVNFIHKKAYDSLGPTVVVGSSVIVFEFIGEDGRLGHGILRQKATDLDEALDLLVGATNTILDAEQKKFPYDEDYPDDL